MTRQFTKGLLAAAVLASALHAGGKAVAPASTPVASVAPAWPLYLGVGIVGTYLQRDPCPCTPNGPEIEDTRYGGILRAGWDLWPNLALEFRALQTFEEDVFSKTRHYGLYLRPNYDLGDRVNLYGLLGYGHTKIDYTNGKSSSTTTHNGIAYGVGVEVDLDGEGQHSGWGLFADFSRILKNAGPKHTDADIFAAGVMYRF